ncbi:reticulocyte binding protein, putative, fragment [Plasmodium vinckei brucechwatti]|uniref:Reticulocyte binding protein, putative n=1 Tax=Plasmodium vinckei brucechwatti TaxID=119398 RepID=A0A6V7S7C1_PLAVN|nr:reticulocyte binding protein, putative, fragment [Plasmodium vinckei brucechwatti]
MLNHLIQKNLNITSDLRNRKQCMQNHNNLHTINRKDFSQTRNAGNDVKYAKAIEFGLVLYYAIIKFKKNDKDEMDLDESEGFMMTLKMGVLKEKISYRNKHE